MPAITALIHTDNDALRLGRLLETLNPCDRLVVVDHGSQDGTRRVAREYGATVLNVRPRALPSDYLIDQPSAWVLCLQAHESLTESLAASLFEWKLEAVSPQAKAFSVFLREETAGGWIENPQAQTRLVPADWTRWSGSVPANDSSAVALEGELLRFVFP